MQLQSSCFILWFTLYVDFNYFQISVIPWHLLYPCISYIMVFACSFFNTEYNIGRCKLNTKVAYRLTNALCLLLTDVITDRWYTELDPTAHRHVLDFISGDGIFKRNTNIKKKHMQWMHLQAQGISFQEKKMLKAKGGYARRVYRFLFLKKTNVQLLNFGQF